MVFILFFIISVKYLTFNQNEESIFSYKGTNDEMYLKRGKYKIDIYGAQGGYGYGDGVKSGIGGKGAHISAEFYITSETSKRYYILVGGQGVPNSNDPGLKPGPNRGGFNGGGSGGEDLLWNPSTDRDDGPGGGGGASDIRTTLNNHKTRLIVSSGGSGGSWWGGNPGGGLCGLKRELNGSIVCSQNTNTKTDSVNKCINTDGKGGNGANSYETPRGGGGGGYCGGFSDNGEEPKPHFTSDSGSSYVKECKENQYEKELCFFNVVIESGIREGDGMIKIKRLWECQDANCLYCKDAKNKCEICKDNFLYYNGKCVTECPPRTIQDGINCYDCAEGCDVCIGETFICTKCIEGYYLYHYECMQQCPPTTTISEDQKECVDCEMPCYLCSDNATSCTHCVAGYYLYNNQCLSQCPRGTFTDDINCSLCNDNCDNCTDSADYCLECKKDFFFFNNSCYLNCSDLNDENEHQFFGKSYDDFQCHKCSDGNCIDCSENFSVCNECLPLFYLNSTTFQCIHLPTNAFSSSTDFSLSNVFSKSIFFSYSKLFSNSIAFSNSIVFSLSTEFTKSNDFLLSEKFSISDSFTYSKVFSISNVFSNSNTYSKTNAFSISNDFLLSEKFSISNCFTYSKDFSISNVFSNSNTYTKTNVFSVSNNFSDSIHFTSSDIFTKSNSFSPSNDFTSSLTFSKPFNRKTTITNIFSISIVSVKSVSYLVSFYLSNVFVLTKVNNEFSIISSYSYLSNYFPYVIRFYHTTLIPVISIIELPKPKRITREKLIAICCSSASIFFFSLALIIIIYQKNNSFDSTNEIDFSYSDEDKNIIKNENTNENLNDNEKLKSDDDLEFWL